MIEKFYTGNITEVSIQKPDFEMDIETDSFFIGSCFSTNLFNKFRDLFLNANNSPFGNVYNPLSICKSLEMLLDSRELQREQLINSDGLFQHPDFHSTMGEKDPDYLLKKLNSIIRKSGEELSKSNLLIITFGTAFVYEKEGQVVNNCHKLDKQLFRRRELGVNEISDTTISILKRLIEINPQLKIVLTLSPVRHLRDNATENSLSKSILRLSINEISKEVPIYYFPSYEILLDELRDYRWYDSSLTHPSKDAISYIISNFFKTVGNSRFLLYTKRIERLNSMLNHKIINRESKSSIEFLAKREQSLLNLKNEFKGLKSLQEIKSSQYL